MNETVYHDLSEGENTHWWFSTQQKAIALFLARHLHLSPAPASLTSPLTSPLTVLDAGCGTGRFLNCLRQYGPVIGIEKHPAWAHHCLEKGYKYVWTGRAEQAAEQTPFPDHHFDIIACFDVLEHIDDDQRVLDQFQRLLKPGGWLFLSVPAGPAFFSINERRYGHFRRYNLSTLAGKLNRACFEIRRRAYFNCLLLPPIVAIRKICDWFRITTVDELKINPVVNRFLTMIISLELPVLARGSCPFGLSLMVSAQPGGREVKNEKG